MKIFEKNNEALRSLSIYKSKFPLVRVYEQGRNTKNPEDAICVLNDYSSTDLIDLVKANRFCSVVPMQEGYEGVVGKVSRALSNKHQYFEDPDKVLFENCIEKIKVDYHQRNEKEKIITAATFFTQAFNSRVADSTRAVVEEIFMNAIFDAPRERQKSKSSRKLPSEWREMLFARDEHSLIVSGRDLFGTLDVFKFLCRLCEVESHGAGKVMNMNIEKGGAGIGCQILFSHSSNIWLGVEKGKQTRVTCEIPLGLSHRKMAVLKKGIHIIKL